MSFSPKNRLTILARIWKSFLKYRNTPTKIKVIWAVHEKRDDERLPETLAGLHFPAFAILMLKRFMDIMN
jgi:hypothetical protein